MASSTPSSGGVPDKRHPSEKSTYQASTASSIRLYDARALMSGRTCAAILSVGTVRMCIGENAGTGITTARKARNRERNLPRYRRSGDASHPRLGSHERRAAAELRRFCREMVNTRPRGRGGRARCPRARSWPLHRSPIARRAGESHGGGFAKSLCRATRSGSGAKKRSFGRDISAKRSGVRLRARPRAGALPTLEGTPRSALIPALPRFGPRSGNAVSLAIDTLSPAAPDMCPPAQASSR
jgi:hypothetical protein